MAHKFETAIWVKYVSTISPSRKGVVDQGGRIQSREHLQGFWWGLSKEVSFYLLFTSLFTCQFIYLFIYFFVLFFVICYLFFFFCFVLFFVLFFFIFIFFFLFLSLIPLLLSFFFLGKASMDSIEIEDAFWVLGWASTKKLQES